MYIDKDRFLFLMNIVRELKLEHGCGYDPAHDESYLRIDNEDKDLHMLFRVRAFNMVWKAND